MLVEECGCRLLFYEVDWDDIIKASCPLENVDQTIFMHILQYYNGIGPICNWTVEENFID